MKKETYLKTHTPEEYEAYKKKQAALTKKWRKNNLEKSRTYGRDYYYKHKKEVNIECCNNGQKH